MKPHSFLFDRKLFDILKKEKRKAFTTKELRDAYASSLKGTEFKLADVRLYVYEEIRRMMRVGWVVPDKQKKARDQIYHLHSQPAELSIEFIDDGFNKWLSGDRRRTGTETNQATKPKEIVTPSRVGDIEQLESLMKETQLEMLASLGEVERYKQLMTDFPDIKGKIEKEYLSVRDQSSKLLGHIRAMEKTIKLLSRP